VSVTSQLVANGHAEPVPDYVLHLLGVGNLPDGDLQARVCDGRIVDYRFVPYDAPRDTLQVLSRRMITRLPPPDPVVSPPPDAVVPVGQPVFYSARESDWQPVDGTLTVDGVTAEVRATPVSLRIIPGDPFAPSVSCQGPGRAFDPDLAASPRRQADRPDTCAVAYTTATDGRSSTRSPRAAARDFARPATWFGTVTVLWDAEWRVDGGPWTSLGRIPRTRLIERSVREVATSIESG
jgi:hypothetical protein